MLSNCQKVNIKVVWGDNLGLQSRNLHDPYIYSTTVLYDTPLNVHVVMVA